MNPAVETAKLLSFLIFIALGVRVARTRGDARGRAIRAFIAYVMVMNLFSGITQIDNWPFTNNILAVGRGFDTTPVNYFAYYGVGTDHREWRLDPYTFSPVFPTILQYWIETRYPKLDDAERLEAEQFLVARANGTRAALHAGHGIGFEKWLGPLHSPYWWVLPRQRRVPAEPYLAMRIYQVHFVPRDYERDPSTETRKLVMEWPR